MGKCNVIIKRYFDYNVLFGDIMVYESLLDKIKHEKKVRCPDCGSGNMKFMQHLNMYGGYVCSGCSKIWDAKDAKIKEQKKRLI